MGIHGCLFLNHAGKNKYSQALGLFKCKCGKEFNALIYHVRSGNTKSCGCIQKKAVSNANRKHGLIKHRLYKIWCGIISRCQSPNNKGYKWYGGWGISICGEWRYDFQAFYDHVTQLPYYNEEGRTLDRTNNNGNYEPGNVRWATMKQQQNNRRCTK